jgi:hypothetical protein
VEFPRLLVAICLPFFVYFSRAFVVYVGHLALPVIRGIQTAEFNRAKTIGTMGWDYAGVSLGLYVGALMNGESTLQFIQSSVPASLRNFVVLISCFLFLMLYCPAIFVRFAILERWDRLNPDQRMLWGFVSWTLGSLLVLATSSLVVRH